MALVAVVLAALLATSDAGSVIVRGSGPLSPVVVEAVTEGAAVVGADVAVIDTGTLRLLAVTRDGTDVQRPPEGFGYPMAVAARDPSSVNRRHRLPLEGGGAVVSERSAALRGAAVGDVLTLEGWNGEVLELAVAAVAPDPELGWAEILVSTATARRLGLERPTRIELRRAADAGVARLAVESLLPPTERIIVEVGEDAGPVLPAVLLKERFGEFSYRLAGDRIEIEDEWVARNIVTVDLPALGSFRCHRLVVPYLRRAMEEVTALRLDWLIDTGDFQQAGGCFNPRLVRGSDAGLALSRHAWGAAVDINPSANPFGGPSRMEPRVVEVFRTWGFVWGGEWLTPDPMHFEWMRFPDDPDGQGCSSLRLVRSAGDAVGWEVYPHSGTCAPS